MREARLAELKRSSGGPGPGDRDGSGSSNGAARDEPGAGAIGSLIAGHLQPQALERLTRVSLVRPDRAKAVEQYLVQLLRQGTVTHKITEDEIVQILHGVAREQNKKNETKIIFNRRELVGNDELFSFSTKNSKANDDTDDDEDDFFD